MRLGVLVGLLALVVPVGQLLGQVRIGTLAKERQPDAVANGFVQESRKLIREGSSLFAEFPKLHALGVSTEPADGDPGAPCTARRKPSGPRLLGELVEGVDISKRKRVAYRDTQIALRRLKHFGALGNGCHISSSP
jgi:hypothetical protein